LKIDWAQKNWESSYVGDEICRDADPR
jgi:hypothetical protein